MGVVRTISNVILLLMLSACFGCSSSYNREDEGFNDSVFMYEWALVEDEQAMTLKLGLVDLSGVIYQGSPLVESELIRGTWVYSVASKNLSMRINRVSTGIVKTTDYEVIEISNYSMRLRNKQLNKEEHYLKIVENHEVKVGQSFDIKYPQDNSLSLQNCKSSNPEILTIDTYGLFVANGIGLFFVTLQTNVGSMIVKVSVI